LKRFLVAFAFVVLGAFGATGAHATCADGYFEYGTDCIESKFEITTIEMDADTTFSFYISAMGTFYVDWGDQVQEIIRANTTETLYSHTYTAGGVKTIRFGGLATGYSTVSRLNQASVVPDMAAIRFFTGTLDRWQFDESGSEINIANISGTISAIFPTIGDGGTYATQPRFYMTFANAQNFIGPLSANLFMGLHGNAVHGMWYQTFSGCTNLGGTIPENLFANVSGIGDYIFCNTFLSCSSLTGGIPKDLFKNISGTAQYAFANTFQGCSNLTGVIPKDLFKNIVGDAKRYMFYRCFTGDSNLTGYIWPELFSGIVGNIAGMFEHAFRYTGLYTACPCGTHQYITGYESEWTNKVSCAVGLKSNEHWYNGQCSAICDAGITQLKTSTGLNFPLTATKLTTPSINIGHNNTVCYVPLATGSANSAINVTYGGGVYHTLVPDDITPNGFTGQPVSQ